MFYLLETHNVCKAETRTLRKEDKNIQSDKFKWNTYKIIVITVIRFRKYQSKMKVHIAYPKIFYVIYLTDQLKQTRLLSNIFNTLTA